MSSKFKPGDVNLKKLLVIPHSGNPIDFTEAFVSIAIYEDIFNPFISANIDISDGIGALKSAPLVGGEVVMIEFATPERDKVKYTLIVEAIENVMLVPPLNNMYSYTLACISEEALVNKGKTISKAYSGTVDEIVNKILVEDLKTKKKIVVDKTKGPQDYVVNFLRPLEAVERLAKRSVSLNNESSSYVFFETRDGFHFTTIEALSDEGKNNVGDKIFINSNSSGTKENGRPEEFRDIITLIPGDTPNAFKDIAEGVLKSEVQSFDIIKKTVGRTVFDLKENADKFKKFENGKEESLRIPEKVVERYGKETSRVYFTITDSSGKDTNINEMLPKKMAYSMLTLQGQTLLNVHGDSSLKAGDMINIKYPAAQGVTQDAAKAEKLVTGNHLVLRLCHHIINDASGPRYINAIEATKAFYKR